MSINYISKILINISILFFTKIFVFNAQHRASSVCRSLERIWENRMHDWSQSSAESGSWQREPYRGISGNYEIPIFVRQSDTICCLLALSDTWRWLCFLFVRLFVRLFCLTRARVNSRESKLAKGFRQSPLSTFAKFFVTVFFSNKLSMNVNFILEFSRVSSLSENSTSHSQAC